jgi:oligoribonuclease
MSHTGNLIWIDMEMTGLDPAKERIIEIATVVTDTHLNVLAEGPVFAIHQSEALIGAMDSWNTKQHNASGLVERVRASQVSETEAEQLTIAFLEKWVPHGKSPMCGNSIYQDRRFMYLYMPLLEKYFHYRLLDVSTLKELAARWAPQLSNKHRKESKHLALSDIHDSINELKFYRESLFNQKVISEY